MSAVVDQVFNQAQKLSADEREELVLRLARLDDEPRLPADEHPQITATLQSRVAGPFLPLNTEDDWNDFDARIKTKAGQLRKQPQHWDNRPGVTEAECRVATKYVSRGFEPTERRADDASRSDRLVS